MEDCSKGMGGRKYYTKRRIAKNVRGKERKGLKNPNAEGNPSGILMQKKGNCIRVLFADFAQCTGKQLQVSFQENMINLHYTNRKQN